MGDFAKELEAMYQAGLEQIPAVHNAQTQGAWTLSPQETFEALTEFLAIQRNMIMRIAQEIDELRAATHGGHTDGH